MSVRLLAFFAAGFLGGVLVSWASIHRLRARLHLMEVFVCHRIDAQFKKWETSHAKAGAARPPEAA